LRLRRRWRPPTSAEVTPLRNRSAPSACAPTPSAFGWELPLSNVAQHRAPQPSGSPNPPPPTDSPNCVLRLTPLSASAPPYPLTVYVQRITLWRWQPDPQRWRRL